MKITDFVDFFRATPNKKSVDGNRKGTVLADKDYEQEKKRFEAAKQKELREKQAKEEVSWKTHRSVK